MNWSGSSAGLPVHNGLVRLTVATRSGPPSSTMYAGCQNVLIWSIAALIAATSVGALTDCPCTFLASEVESSANRRVVMPRARSALISAVAACRILVQPARPYLARAASWWVTKTFITGTLGIVSAPRFVPCRDCSAHRGSMGSHAAACYCREILAGFPAVRPAPSSVVQAEGVASRVEKNADSLLRLYRRQRS